MATTPSSPATPKHQQLRDRLLAEIEAGRYKPGQLFPTEAEIAAAEGLSRNTVRHALASLGQRGLIRRIRGKGTIVCGDSSDAEVARLQDFVLIVPDLQTGFYTSLHKGFMDEARETNRQVVVCDTNNDINVQANIFFQLMDRGVGGVALVSAGVGSDSAQASSAHQVRQLQAASVPVVLLHRPIEGIAAPLIGLPYDDIGYRAARRLIEAGHRHIACCYGHSDLPMHLYRAGFIRAMTEAGLTLATEHEHVNKYATFPFSPAVSRDMDAFVGRILEEPNTTRPTAMWCTYDPLAELMLSLLRARGVDVPTDLSLLSFGGSWRGTVAAMQLDAVTIDEVKGGHDAAHVLAQMCRGERPLRDRETIPLEVGLHVGQTVRQLN